ncbi:M15 family metallopeptidase [Nocardioides sp.]
MPGNLRGTRGEIDRDVVRIFKKWGFTWGGDWAWTDPMHFEMNAVVQPR